MYIWYFISQRAVSDSFSFATLARPLLLSVAAAALFWSLKQSERVRERWGGGGDEV